MNFKYDIHRYDEKVDSTIARLKRSKILAINKKHILDYQESCFLRNLSKARVVRCIDILKGLADMLKKDFKKANKSDLIKLIQILDSKPYTDWTKYTYKTILKRFYKWFNGDEEYPDKVKWIKAKVKNGNTKLPEELLNEEDIKKMLNFCSCLRDKALISMLYEAGCRVGELGDMKIKHVSFDEYGSQIIVDGKTGMRRVRLISSSPYLSQWLDMHPQRDEPDAPLWIIIGTRNHGQIVRYATIKEILKRTAARAGIKKRVNPHTFRHSRATYLANHFTDAQLNQHFGWVQGSGMPATYVHLSGRDTDSALLAIHGIKKETTESEKPHLHPQGCPRCTYSNPATNKFCSRCGGALDIKTAVIIDEKKRLTDEVMGKLMEDSNIRAIFNQKVTDLGLNEKLFEIFGENHG